jgi:prepilin-type N-terminal cleavage/methylation domain-containing protein
MTNTAHTPAGRVRRRGFSLVELLVVIAIIGVLIGLSAAAYFSWLDTQRRNTTETTMRQVYETLKRQMKAVADQADKEVIPDSVRAMAGGDDRRARVIWKKLRLRQEFPTTFAEAQAPWQASDPAFNLPPGDLPPRYAQSLQSAAPGTGESSACLVLALQKVRGGVRLNPDELPNTALTDTNGDNLKEIVDGWGNPLTFYRWPTSFDELRATNPAAAGSKGTRFADPLDPDGLLLTPGWYWQGGVVGTPNPQRLQFESLCHPISPDNGQTAYYIIPALGSAGPDGDFTTPEDNLFTWRFLGTSR